MNEQVFNVAGMVCNGCASNVENAVKALPGVTGIQVSLTGQKLKLQMNPAKITAEKIVKAVKDTGYNASPAPQP